jgi:DNA polymerase-3 subunit alpha
VAGLIIAMRTMNTRRGDKMAFITIDDRSGRIEIALFSDIFERYRNMLTKDKVIVVDGEVSVDDYSGGYKMRALNIYDIDHAREHFGKRLALKVSERRAGNGFIGSLEQLLIPFREGGCPVCLDYISPGATARIELGDGWQVRPTDELLHRLRNLVGDDAVTMEY